MRFLGPLALFIAAAAATADSTPELQQLAVGEIQPGVEARGEVLGGHLKKRACVANGCKCDSRGKQFHSCGNCVWTNNGAWVVTKKRVANHIFECAPNGDCCDYGAADDCGGPNARCYKQ